MQFHSPPPHFEVYSSEFCTSCTISVKNIRLQITMYRFLLAISVLFGGITSLMGQERIVQNRPYTDLRPFHFGIHVGAHMQDVEFINAGHITIENEDGTTSDSYITADQDRMDPGFNVGVLGEFRLSELFQLRIAPAIYFGSRHISFYNNLESTPDNAVTKRQDLKTAYVMSSFDLIFAAPRFNNHRVYMMAGVVPALNLTGKSTDYLRLKRYQTLVELGIGLDQYLPYFKCRPELKFMFGLGNALDTEHYKGLRDRTMIAYSRSVSEAHTKMITLSFYFE